MSSYSYSRFLESYLKVGVVAFGLLAMACGEDSRPDPVASGAAATRLASAPFASLSLEVPLPYGPWSGPLEVPLSGWEIAAEDATSRSYEAVLPEPIPSDAVLLYRAGDAPEALRVVERLHSDLRPSGAETRSSDGTWSLSQRRIVKLRLSKMSPPPNDASHSVAFPAVTRRERSWSFSPAQRESAEEFVRRQIDVASTTRRGLLLPAPARVSWHIEVPPGAELSFAPGVLPPDWEHRPLSNGARLNIDVRAAAKPFEGQRVYSEHIRGAEFSPVRLNLSAFSGQRVELIFEVDPVGASLRDYLFVAEPVVVSRRSAARRAVVLFVDTLRPDRLGFYGNAREVSPALDRWASQAGVFLQARSVAPWTLPSVRSLLTGRAPEAWDASPTLAGLFGEHGFATAMFGANTYLLSNFRMQRDWDEHSVRIDATATEQTDRALRWLAQHDGRDALLVVHYMDPHLPYREPAAYRGRFDGGPEPELLRSKEGIYSREDVLQAVQGVSREEVQAFATHLLARYDANVRYVDDEIARLLAALSPEDLVVLVSDHGEEFFDYGGFEHGHDFGEAVMRIPLVFAGRGTLAGRYAEPVSILDVVPTLLDAFGIVGPGPGTGAGELGRSLWPLLQSGEEQAGEARALAFGRPLHGPSGWGVVRSAEKYVARAGSERRSQVSIASLEEGQSRTRRLDPASQEPLRDLLAEVLDREFVWAWRLAVGGVEDWPPADVTRRFAFDGAIGRAWVGVDPTLRSSVNLKRGVAPSDPVEITWRAGYRGPSEVFVVAQGGAPRALLDTGYVELGSGQSLPLSAGRELEVSRAWIPMPVAGTSELIADDPELRSQLRALGYLVGEDAPPSPSGASPE